MSNTCFSHYHFKGNNIIDLYNAIKNAEDRLGYIPFVNILKSVGLYKEGDKLPCSCRGDVTYCDLVSENELEIDTETACSSLSDIWFIIRSHLNGDYTISYVADEGGCGYFAKYDEAEEFDDIEYNFDFCCDNDEDDEFLVGFSDWYDNGLCKAEEVEEMLDNFFKFHSVERPTEETLSEKIDFFNKYIEDKISDDTYVGIHKYFNEREN